VKARNSITKTLRVIQPDLVKTASLVAHLNPAARFPHAYRKRDAVSFGGIFVFER
jgi:hypothetical protein